ncbi:MAG TPA: hypothetical protein VJT49_11140 [Amycolatopsis sp.]|uniref:hypothetical protein n=1 Tax=Amycolatopsis sp. TaxID=37632 RepID=UPI002B461FE2|nr:hypothetical protein [Amycolatopsis sp.]HKS45646.1 hypothetical protein [Amycolatopsis sp.]
MTYPPQQPGPYGPQDPHGNEGRWGSRPGCPQPGYPGGGSPQTGPQPGAARQFAQPDAWDRQPVGYPGYQGEEPPKKKTGLIVGAVIAAVLLIGGGVTALILFTGNDDKANATAPGGSAPPALGGAPNSAPSSTKTRTSPAGGTGDTATVKDIASKFMTALIKGDATELKQHACPSRPINDALVQPIPGATFKIREVTVNGGKATVSVDVTQDGKVDSGKLVEDKESGRWCVSDVTS